MAKPLISVLAEWLNPRHPFYRVMQHLSCTYTLTTDAEVLPQWRFKDDRFVLHVDSDRLLAVDDAVCRSLSRARLHRKGSTLINSMGKGKPDQRWILDATAGLGQDAFRLAAAGYRVLAIERNPALALLLHAFVAEHRRRYPILDRVVICCADSAIVMRDYPLYWPKPSVVYLDPMFESPRTAAQKKRMQALSAWLGNQGDSDALLAPARALASERVVVKRGRMLPPLAGVLPDQMIASRAGRPHVVMQPFVVDDRGHLKRHFGATSGASRFDVWLSAG
jgi:hypothetical protein